MSVSLRGRLAVLWAMSVASALVVGWLMVALYRQSAVERVGRAEAEVSHACDIIAGHYQFYTAGLTQPPADLRQPALHSALVALVEIALARQPGVAGGIWAEPDGLLAYAFPAPHPGAGTGLPAADRAHVQSASLSAINTDAAVTQQFDTGGQTVLLRACPLPGPIPSLAAWTMARVNRSGGATYRQMVIGLAVLLAGLLLSAAWLGGLVMAWTRRLGRIEAALAQHDLAELPALEPTGARELDRIVGALNQARSRLAASRAREAELASRMARSERLAALGRLAAGVAHEIRNPIGAMRLKAENGLAGDAAKRTGALQAVLGLIGRLDTLLGDLLRLTSPGQPQPHPTDLNTLLNVAADLHRDRAAERGMTIRVRQATGDFPLDSALIGRAIENLVLNAIQNGEPGGEVVLSAATSAAGLTLRVADDGSGVPESIRAHLFEPFVHGRADGTGLGLSIVRELAATHDGTARLVPTETGATFEVMLPWPAC